MKFLTALNTRARSFNPQHGAILAGIAWVTLFVLIGKLMGAAKEMAVAYRYGVGAEVDAYLYVLNFVNWPTAVWFSVLTLVLVPLAARMRSRAPHELPRFRAELFGAALLLGLGLAVLTWGVVALLLRSPWAGLPPATAALAAEAVPSLAATIPMAVLISLFSAWMLADGRHANTLFEGIPAAVIAVAILLTPLGGIEPLVWATLIGTACHLAALAIPLRKRKQLEAPRFSYQSDQWSAFKSGFGVMLVGNALMNLIVIADLFVAAQLGTGSIATLSYANRILALIIGLGGTAVSRATLPVFSKERERQGGKTDDVVLQWARLMLFTGAAAIVVVWWLAPYMVKFLFERGAFKPEDTVAVTEVLRYGLAQLPFYFAALVLVSGLVSRGMHKWVAFGAVLNLFVKIGANYVLVPLLGINGVILATGVMYLVSFVLLYWISFSARTRGSRSNA